MGRARECGNKRGYASRKIALRERMKLLYDSGAAPARYTVYKCKHCRAWHIGHRGMRRR